MRFVERRTCNSHSRAMASNAPITQSFAVVKPGLALFVQGAGSSAPPHCASIRPSHCPLHARTDRLTNRLLNTAGNLFVQTRPSNNRMMRISTINPTPPLG